MSSRNIAYMTTSDFNMYGGGWIRDATLVNNIRLLGRPINFYSTFYKPFSDDSVECDGLYFKVRDVLLAHNIPKYYNLPAFPEFENPLKNIPYLNNISIDSFNFDVFSKKIRKNFDSLIFDLIPFDVKQKQEFEVLKSLEQGIDGKLKREVMSFKNRLVKDKVRLLNTSSLLWSKVSSDIKKNTGLVDVATIQGYDMIYTSYRDEYRKEIVSMLKENVKSTDSFIAISKYYAGKASSDLDIPLKNIHVIYNGIDTEKYKLATVKKDTKCFMITYLGRIDPKKGLINLVVAAKHMVDGGHKNFRINVIGSFDRRDSSYINMVQQYISLLKIGGIFDVRLNVSLKEKIKILNISDVVVYPTLYPEPFGLVPIEAMACGTPVVLPEHGAFPEIIKETGGGLLFRPNDSYDLSEKLIALMEDRDMLQELSADGLKAVRDKFNARLMAEKVLKVYDCLV
ncbi:MAG: glycosyltransferase family 4 protein [archaeon]|nr:glycosyltransferase family 4 protein [archaeon]